MANKEPPRETALGVACLLSLSGAFLDAFTYVEHGRVFANAMTGNVVLLGVFAATGHWSQAARHIPPIIAFLAGVVAAQAIRHPRLGFKWPAFSALLIEIAVLIAIAFLPQSFPDIWIVLSISFAAALQNSSFTRVRSLSYNSVMTTGNLRKFSESLFGILMPGRGPEECSQAEVFGLLCLSFLVGAFIGGVATRWMGNPALWVPAAVMAAVAVWSVYPHKAALGGDIEAPS